MDDVDQHRLDLELMDRMILKITDRMFASRRPQDLRQAIIRFKELYGRPVALESYWELLINGLQKDVDRKGV